MDLGAIKHIITKKEYFISYKDSQGRLGWGTDGIGNVELVNNGNKIVLENCLYAPDFAYNLISVSKLDQLGYKLRVKNNQAYIYKNNQLLISAVGRDSLYHIDIVNHNLPNEKTTKVKQKETKKVEQNKQINKIEPTNTNNLLEQKNKIKLWHQRMGHINHISLQKTLGLQSDVPLDVCEICIKSKLTNQRNKQITPKPKVYLEKVVTDLCGPISPPTINGERYIIFFLNSATRHLKFKLLKFKSEAYDAFIEFKNRAENNTKKRKI